MYIKCYSFFDYEILGPILRSKGPNANCLWHSRHTWAAQLISLLYEIVACLAGLAKHARQKRFLELSLIF